MILSFCFLLAKFVAFINFTKSLFSLILLLKWDVLSVDLLAASLLVREDFLGEWAADEAMDGGKINCGGELRCNAGDSFELFYQEEQESERCDNLRSILFKI